MSKAIIAAKFRCYRSNKIAKDAETDEIITRHDDIDQINIININNFIKGCESLGYPRIKCVETFGLNNSIKEEIKGTDLAMYSVDYFNDQISKKKDPSVEKPSKNNKVIDLLVKDNELLKSENKNIKDSLSSLNEKLDMLLSSKSTVSDNDDQVSDNDDQVSDNDDQVSANSENVEESLTDEEKEVESIIEQLHELGEKADKRSSLDTLKKKLELKLSETENE